MTKKHDFEIHDIRHNTPAGYPPIAGRERRTRMKNSWHMGVERRTDGNQCVSFDDGLSWGSIGQMLGYLLGEQDEGFKNDLYERMWEAFQGTDRWASGGNKPGGDPTE